MLNPGLHAITNAKFRSACYLHAIYMQSVMLNPDLHPISNVKYRPACNH